MIENQHMIPDRTEAGESRAHEHGPDCVYITEEQATEWVDRNFTRRPDGSVSTGVPSTGQPDPDLRAQVLAYLRHAPWCSFEEGSGDCNCPSGQALIDLIASERAAGSLSAGPLDEAVDLLQRLVNVNKAGKDYPGLWNEARNWLARLGSGATSDGDTDGR